MQNNDIIRLKRDKIYTIIIVCGLLILTYLQIMAGIARRLDEFTEESTSFSNFLFLIIITVFLLFFIAHQQKQIRIRASLLIFLVYIFVGRLIITNISFKDLFSSILLVFWCMCFLFGCNLVKTNKEIVDFFIKTINIMVILPIGLYCVFLFFTTDISAYQGSTDAYFAIIVYFPFVLLLDGKNRFLKSLNMILLLTVSILSIKRSIIIGITGSLLVFFLFSEHRRILLKWYFWFVLIIVILLGRELSGVVSETIYYRFENIENDRGSGREYIYQNVYNSIQQGSVKEILFGHGYQSVNAINGGKLAHDDFLQLLYDYGLVGMVSYAFFLLSMVHSLIKCFFKRNSNKSLFAAYCSSLLFFLLLISLNCFVYSIMLISPIMMALGILETKSKYELL